MHDPLQVARNDTASIPQTVEVTPEGTFFEPIEVTAVNARNILIQWFLLPTNENTATLTYEIYRAFSRVGPYTQIGTAPGTQFYFLDNDVPAVSKWDEVWYLVAAILPDSTLQYSDPNHMRGIPPGRILAINDQARIVYCTHNGVGVLVYKRRREGNKCGLCWDAIQGISTDDACPICFGTGLVQGYYPPVRTRCLITPTMQKIDYHSHQHASAIAQANMLRYPRVQPNDVLYEENSSRWWYVGTVAPNEDNRILVTQDVTLKQADPHDKIVDLLAADVAGNLLLPVV